MRIAFTKTLVELAERDPRIMLLTGDLGFMVLEPFAERFPQRFINVGVAEQNMVGLATGLAEAGFVPFVYSITPFATLRPYEFIRNGPVQHHLPVRIVGVGGGVEYGENGISHYGLEDIGVMRIQPGMTVVAPGDYEQARTALRATWDQPGPAYYRLSKDDRTVIPGLDGRFELGRVQTLAEGSHVLFVATGNIVSEALAAADLLRAEGISCAVILVASVAPPPITDLVAMMGQFPLVITVEAHYVAGGLGSLVSEVAAEHALGCRVVRCGVRDLPRGVSGGQAFLYDRNGISRTRLAATVRLELERTRE